MESPIKAVGKEMLKKGMEYKFGLMGLNMMVIGFQGKLMVKENSIILTGMYMKGTGRMVRLMDMEFLSIILVADTKDIGKMISSKDLELKLGLMGINMKEAIN